MINILYWNYFLGIKCYRYYLRMIYYVFLFSKWGVDWKDCLFKGLNYFRYIILIEYLQDILF